MTRPTPPFLDPEIRKAALEKARVAREARSALLSDIREGRVSLAELIGDAYKDNTVVQRLQVLTAMRATPRVSGPVARAFLTANEISHERRIGGLGRRQREVLLNWKP